MRTRTLATWSDPLPLVAALVPGWACASAAVAVSVVEGREPSVSLAVATCLFGYGSYAIDRIPEASPAARGARTMLAAAALIGSLLVTAAAGGTTALGLLLVFPLSVALYGTPLLGQLLPGLGIRRVKDIPYFKGIYTALVWGLLGVYAASFGGAPQASACVFAFVFLTLHLLVNTLYCDAKDLARDRAEGVRTIVAALGLPRTLRLLHALNVVAALAVVPGVLSGALPGWALALSLTGVVPAVVLVLASRPRADHAQLALAMELGVAGWAPIALVARALA